MRVVLLSYCPTVHHSRWQPPGILSRAAKVHAARTPWVTPESGMEGHVDMGTGGGRGQNQAVPSKDCHAVADS